MTRSNSTAAVVVFLLPRPINSADEDEVRFAGDRAPVAKFKGSEGQMLKAISSDDVLEASGCRRR